MALQITGIHHIVLTVSDPKRAASFYERILDVKADFETESVICIPCGNFLLCLQKPPRGGNPGDRFDENRLGLDHIGFSVASRNQLNKLLDHLKKMGIPTSGIEFDQDGQSDYVCFRDPDNIQIEFYMGEFQSAMS
jgi:catechol 2,3-dioxygenase-like lactoylglutathione lyase family enzyme